MSLFIFLIIGSKMTNLPGSGVEFRGGDHMTLNRLTFVALWALILALTPSGASGRSEGAIRRTFEFPAGITHLIVEADRQDLVVTSGGPGVAGRLIGGDEDSAQATQTGATLTIQVRADRWLFPSVRRQARLELTVPPGLELTLTTASGAVVVQVPTALLKVRTASGDIEAPGGGQAADLSTASGTLRLKGFGGPVRAEALSGNLLLEACQGLILASSLSGNLMGKALVPGTGSRFSSASGNVQLDLAGGSQAYTVNAQTASGVVDLGAKGASGPVITVRSLSGNIQVP